jgi:hypothetical protein
MADPMAAPIFARAAPDAAACSRMISVVMCVIFMVNN